MQEKDVDKACFVSANYIIMMTYIDLGWIKDIC